MDWVHGGLAANQGRLEDVVGGVNRGFTSWVLKSQVGVAKTIGLRKELMK